MLSDGISQLSLKILDSRFTGGRSRKKAIVAVLTDIPFWEPTLGSHARVASTLKAIDTWVNIKVFAFRTVHDAIRRSFESLDIDAELVSYKLWTETTKPAFIPRLSKYPPLMAQAQSGWTQAAFNFLKATRPNFVLIEYVNRSYLLDAVPAGTRTILDAHDVMSQRALSFIHTDKKPGILLTAEQEANLLAEYSAVMAISPADVNAMRCGLGLKNVLYVPHAAPAARLASVRPNARRLLFVGGNSEANVLGLRWFLAQVWPLVSDRFELHVIGTVCNAIDRPPVNVVLRGVVDDLAAAHYDSDIAINPVFIGGGLKIKTLDAMGYGLPCVTTPEGARGLEAAEGTGLLVARKRLDFAGYLFRLGDDAVMRASMGVAAHEYVQAKHAPSVAFRDLIMFLTHA